MLLGQRLDSLPGVAVAQILGLRARLASPRAALPPLTPPVGHPLACRQAPPRVRGSRPRILSTAVGCAAQGAWPPHWRPCPLWPPRRMPHGPVRRFWPRGPLWAARPDDPVARVRLRLGGRPACGSQKNQRSAGAGSVASAGRRGRADPVCARKACRRVPAPGRGRPRPGRRSRRVTRRGLRLSPFGRTPPARGRRARRSPCCTRGRSPASRRVRPC